jgi:hypothetical protein
MWCARNGLQAQTASLRLEVRVQVLERERSVVQLYIRGLTWFEIARQLGLETEGGARHVFHRAVKRMPPGDVEFMRKMEGERITDMRRRIWSELAGRPDPVDPTKTIRPGPSLMMEILDRAGAGARAHDCAALCARG